MICGTINCNVDISLNYYCIVLLMIYLYVISDFFLCVSSVYAFCILVKYTQIFVCNLHNKYTYKYKYTPYYKYICILICIHEVNKFVFHHIVHGNILATQI